MTKFLCIVSLATSPTARCARLVTEFDQEKLTYPSEYCKTLPFLDHAHQCSPGSTLSLLFKMRKVFGVSVFGGFETLQTRRSPSTVCVASMSDLCFVEEACHTRLATAEGERAAVNVCRIVKDGCSPTIMMDPF